MPKKASLCCLKTWWKWAIWVLIEWETKYFIIYIFYHPGCSRPHHSSFHDLRICTLCPFIPEHIHPSVTHISLFTGLWDPLYSHHDLPISQPSTNGILKTLLLSMSCSYQVGKKQHLLWLFQAICAPTGQSASWPNSNYNFWKFPESWYRTHYCLTVDFQEAFSNKIIWLSASLFRLAEDGQRVLKFLKEYNKDISTTISAIINILTHLLHYLGFGLA